MNHPICPALPSGYPRDISREAMNALPIRRYEGEVVLVENLHPENLGPRQKHSGATELGVSGIMSPC